jgi:hypothetical protein
MIFMTWIAFSFDTANWSDMGTTPPELLFHYTTLPGIIGIAENRHVRATSIRHLADATEFRYAHRLLEETLRTKASAAGADVVATINVLLFHLAHVGQSQLNFGGSLGSIFVASFSSEGDQLSQWRAYCPGGGYALGFRTAALAKLASEQGFELRQCSYDAEVHRGECEKIADEVLNAVAAIPKQKREALLETPAQLTFEALQVLYPVQRGMVDSIQIHAPTWKHPSFREEAEWRLISQPRDRSIKFRPGRTAIVPHVEFRIDQDSIRVGDQFAVLGHTVVGPCSEPELAVGSAMLLFEQNKIARQEFSISNTPYRSW